VNNYWGNRPGGVRPPGWNRPTGSSGGGLHRPLVPGALPSGRPVIGFRPPTQAVGHLKIQNNVYTRLPGQPSVVPKLQTSDKSRPATGRPNNVYADKNGDVYRKTKEGWQQRTNNTWKSSGGGTGSGPKTSGKTVGKAGTALPSTPSTRMTTHSVSHTELERDVSARQRGDARAQSWSRSAAPAAPVTPKGPAPSAHAPQKHTDQKKH
jgi:hypothetical protein